MGDDFVWEVRTFGCHEAGGRKGGGTLRNFYLREENCVEKELDGSYKHLFGEAREEKKE